MTVFVVVALFVSVFVVVDVVVDGVDAVVLSFLPLLFYMYSLFTVSFTYARCHVIQRECEAISGSNNKIARNCLTYTLDYINCEKGYCRHLVYPLTSTVRIYLCCSSRSRLCEVLT